MKQIDFVILWVDGNDKKWQTEKQKYQQLITKDDISNQKNRFRDWDLLRYWFRGVEKNAPWVHKIHFVTYGHVPAWLNVHHPKINIVKHEDFIPHEYLPTFNSNVIQYYLNRIPGITSEFVMFDDDQFILKKVSASDFFQGDKICDEYAENAIYTSVQGDVYPHSLLNNMQVINTHYHKKDIYRKDFFKYINIKYGFKNILSTLLLMRWTYFVGIYNPHICQAYTKKHYELFWQYCEKELKENSTNRFRQTTDLTTFLIRYIALLEGDFIPRSHHFGLRVELGENNQKIYKMIKERKYHVLCINDSNPHINFLKIQKELITCFESIFKEKSSFEIE